MACEICHATFAFTVSDDPDYDAKPHVCTTCGKSFSLKIQLKRHVLSHAGGTPFICIDCEKKGAMVSNSKRFEKKTHVCDICDKEFLLKRLLNKHYLSHTTAYVYSCDECYDSFSSAALLKKHFQIHKPKKGKVDKKEKGETSTKLYVCSVCCKAFALKASFEKHCATHVSTPNADHSQLKVGNDFSDRELSMKHKRRRKSRIDVDYAEDNSESINKKQNSGKDSGDRTRGHVCDTCGKTFSRKSALEGHYLIHIQDSIEEEKSDAYSDKESAAEVIKIAKIPKVKSFQCKLCDNAFTSKSKLKKHSLTHADEISEIFAMDNKEETNDQQQPKVEKLILKRQKREKKFACKRCNKMFVGENCFKKHMKLKHNLENGEIASMEEEKKDNEEGLPLKKERKKKIGAKKESNYICEFCNEDFSAKRGLFTRHRISHTPEVCGICDQRFINREALREHCKSHIGTEEARRFLECSQKAFNVKKGISSTTPEPKVEYIYLVLR